MQTINASGVATLPTPAQLHSAVDPENAQTGMPAAIADSLPASTFTERVAKRWGRPLIERLMSKRLTVVKELGAIPDRMQKVTNQARLVMELTDDFRTGRYRDVSWLSIAVAAAGLVYAVSPGDVIPDALPGLGALDDMVVLTLAMRFLEKDLRAYCRFRGYEESQYF